MKLYLERNLIIGKNKYTGITEIKSLKQLPDWNYDGSSTEQAPGEDSEQVAKSPSTSSSGAKEPNMAEEHEDMASAAAKKTKETAGKKAKETAGKETKRTSIELDWLSYF